MKFKPAILLISLLGTHSIVNAEETLQLAALDSQTDKLEKVLNTKSIELSWQQNESEQTQPYFHTAIQQLLNDPEIQSLESLNEGINFVLYYDNDNFDLKQEIHRHIEQLAELIKPYSNIQIKIEGYTDRRGSEKHNLALSQARATKVYNTFIKAGIPDTRIDNKAFGEHRAAANKADYENYHYDRRVTINLSVKREA